MPKKRRITSPLVYEPEEGTWSNCFLVGDQIVLAGMVSLDKDRQVVGENDAYAQSIQAFTNMKNLVEAAGGTMADITKLTTFLTNMEHRPAGLVFCPPAEHREPMSGLAIPFSMWQCAGHGDAAGPGFIR